jgi:hypothetical protein
LNILSISLLLFCTVHNIFFSLAKTMNFSTYHSPQKLKPSKNILTSSGLTNMIKKVDIKRQKVNLRQRRKY